MSGPSRPGLSASTPQLNPSVLSTDPATPSLWEKLGSWASENKTVVYTVAGVVIVGSGVGAVYYLSGPKDAGIQDKKLSKSQRRKAKKEKERAPAPQQTQSTPQTPQTPKTPTVQEDPLEGLPQIDEATVGSLSDEVSLSTVVHCPRTC